MDPDPTNPNLNSGHDVSSPSPPPENETATGSAGLFGDLTHENSDHTPAERQKSPEAYPQNSDNPVPPTRQEVTNHSTADDRHPSGTETQYAAHEAQALDQPRSEIPADQPMQLESHGFTVSQSSATEPSRFEQVAPEDLVAQQSLTQASAPVSAQESTAYASTHNQPDHQWQDDNTTNLDQPPPVVEAQLAEEQDLLPDVGNANGKQR